MELKEFATWIIVLVSCSASFLIFNIWFKTDSILLKKHYNNNELHKKDYALFFLAMAFVMWGLGFISIMLDKSGNDSKAFRSILSSLNSLFLLLGTIHLEYSPKWIVKNRENAKRIFVIFSVTTCLITLCIEYKLIERLDINTPDIILSLFTAVLLSYTLAVTFWKREFYILSLFSVLALFLVICAQPTIHFFTTPNDPIIILLGLFSRLLFIVMICLLAYSWAQSKLNVAVKRVGELSYEVDSLKEQVKVEREIANRDERETAWQDIALKAAHKIGNPLDAIDTSATRIQSKLRNDDIKGARSLFSDLNDAIEEAKKILGEFKSLKALNQLNLDECNLTGIINQSAKSMESEEIKIKINKLMKYLPVALQTDKNTLELSSLKESDRVEIVLDADKIKQCFDELIVNSKHFFDKEKKEITFTIEDAYDKIPSELDPSYQYIKITYEDNGIGVPEENKAKIFNHFFTTYKHHGTGLGLTIVQRIVSLHDGIIYECGVATKGAKFEIYLSRSLKAKSK